MISGNLPMADKNGIFGHVPLRDHFFDVEFYTSDPSRIEQVVVGLTKQVAQEIDNKIVEDVRSHLFEAPTDRYVH